MLAVKSVLLEHSCPQGRHFDWCFENPLGPAGDRPLTTFRLPLNSCDWAAKQPIPLLRLPHHRRAYLAYSGPVSSGRGWVKQVDRGSVIVHRWTLSTAQLDVRLGQYTGPMLLRRIGPALWLASP